MVVLQMVVEMVGGGGGSGGCTRSMGGNKFRVDGERA